MHFRADQTRRQTFSSVQRADTAPSTNARSLDAGSAPAQTALRNRSAREGNRP
jgi:hypothetical protein